VEISKAGNPSVAEGHREPSKPIQFRCLALDVLPEWHSGGRSQRRNLSPRKWGRQTLAEHVYIV